MLLLILLEIIKVTIFNKDKYNFLFIIIVFNRDNKSYSFIIDN